jgi:hypothetical protein
MKTLAWLLVAGIVVGVAAWVYEKWPTASTFHPSMEESESC